uniref:Uncharacterized protein n=1 Tax=Schistocephalus solidus TaxID=70667 RepID=A0A0X3PJM0_SCHSO
MWVFKMGKKFSKQRHKPRFTKAQIPWLIRGAIRSNNVETMQYLLSYPNEVNPSMVIDGVCPLNLAVELGHLQMVKLLLKAGADIHVSDCPRYPLHQACLYGRSAVSDLLIRSGAKTVVLTEHYQSCLHLLANQSTERFLETARILLSHNCDPNTLDDDGLAPLHRASLEMVHILASSDKTDLNILSQAGDTPLLTAAKDRREAALLALIHVEQEHQQAALAASELSGARASANRTPSSKSAGSTTSRFTLLTNGSLSTYAVTNSVATPNRQSSGWAQRVFRTASAATIQLQSATSAVFSGSTRPTLVPFAFRQPQPQQQPQPPIELQTLTVADSVTPLPPNTNLSDTKRRKLPRLPLSIFTLYVTQNALCVRL